ncbi:hypothetical protein TWF281_008843 [Arthrobotrys megalospora]
MNLNDAIQIYLGIVTSYLVQDILLVDFNLLESTPGRAEVLGTVESDIDGIRRTWVQGPISFGEAARDVEDCIYSVLVPQKANPKFRTPSLGLGKEPAKQSPVGRFTFMSALKRSNFINTPTYGIDIKGFRVDRTGPNPGVNFEGTPGSYSGQHPRAGYLTFGGVDIAQTTDPIQTYKISSPEDTRTRIDLLRIALHRGNGSEPNTVVERTLKEPGVAYLDYTKDSILLPESPYSDLQKELGPTLDRFFRNSGNLGDIPTSDWGLEFTFPGEVPVNIYVPFEQIIRPLPDGGYAVAVGNTSGDTFVLGQPFFRRAYVFYDYNNDEVSLAAKKDPSPSESPQDILVVGYNLGNTSITYSLAKYPTVQQSSSAVIGGTIGSVVILLLMAFALWFIARKKVIGERAGTLWKLIQETKQLWSRKEIQKSTDLDYGVGFVRKQELSALNVRRVAELGGDGEILELSGGENAGELEGSIVGAELPVPPVELDGEPITRRVTPTDSGSLEDRAMLNRSASTASSYSWIRSVWLSLGE